MDRVMYNAIMIATARVGMFAQTYSAWLKISEANDPWLAADNESVNIVSPSP